MTPRIPTFAFASILTLALVAGLALGWTTGSAHAGPPLGDAPAAPAAPAQDQDDRLPSAEASARVAFLPALRYLGSRDTCEVSIEVMNVGSEPSKAVLVTWGDPGSCQPQAFGPHRVECTGLLVPGSRWMIVGPQLPTGARSGALYSFTARTLLDIGVDLGFDDVVADLLCEELFFGVLGDADEQRRFQKAFNAGEEFRGIPLAKAYGGPLAVEVDRSCDGVAVSGDPTLIGWSAYEGVGGRGLGTANWQDEQFHYAVPIVHTNPGIAESTLVVQNAGLDCASIGVWYQAQGRCTAMKQCVSENLAPGESRTIDVTACAMGDGPGGRAWVEGNQPLAVVVDTREEDTLSSFTAPPVPRLQGSTTPGDQPDVPPNTTGYAPLVYSEYSLWDTRIHVQNASTITDAEVKVYFLDRSGDIITTLRERICPRGSASFVLGQVADLPGNWVGSARVESQEWWSPNAPREVPEIYGVVELVRRKDGGAVSEAYSYNLLSGSDYIGDAAGSDPKHYAQGVGVIAIPHLVKGSPTELSSEFAIANIVGKPGFTDFAIYIYDQNGLLDFVCQKLHDRQVEYIKLDTWGFVNPGFQGSAVVSAVFWEHDVFDPTGNFLRNLVGLAAVSAARSPFNPGGPTGPRVDGDDPGDESLGITGIPLYPTDKADFLDTGMGFIPLCPGIPTQQPRVSATPFPTITRAPTRTPRPTVPPTQGPSPTPRPTVENHNPLGNPPAPPVHLPILNFQGRDDVCESWIDVQSLGDDPAKAVLVTWGEPGFCPPMAAGPLKVECSGLLEPGGGWSFSPNQIHPGAKSGVLFSFTARTLAEAGIDPASSETVADFMCETLFFEVVGAAESYGLFKDAYHNGTEWNGIPLAKTYGPPLAVNVLRNCPGDVTPGVTVSASYNGLTELGAFDSIFGGYGYYVPLIYSDRAGFSTLLYLQNAGTVCSSIEVWFKAQDDCLRARICDIQTMAPGETYLFDASDCQGPDWQGSAWIRASEPLATSVDIFGRDVLMSYEGTPASFSYILTDGSLTEYSAGSRVSYAPLMYSEYQGWDTGIQVQNLSSNYAGKIKVYFLDRSGDIITTLVDWICPRGSQTFFLPVVHDLPGNWVGSVRVESQEWWTENTEANPPPDITGVVTLIKYSDKARTQTLAAVAYNLLPEHEGLSWGKGGEGVGAGGTANGSGLIALPGLARAAADGSGGRSDIAVANLVHRAGYTDYSLLLFDANGHFDTLCQRIHDGQVDYIDLDRWGYVTPAFAGSAIISAGFWQHEVRDATGDFIRNLVGLGAVVVRLRDGPLADSAAIPGDQAAASTGFALDAKAAAGLAGTLDGSLCPRQDVAPSPPGSWPDAEAPPKVHLPVLRAWGDDTDGVTCASELSIMNLGAEPSKAILLAFEGEGACAAPGTACTGPSAIECTGLIAPGATWQISAGAIPPQTRSGIVYSLSAKTTAELGIPRPVPAVVADVICDALRAGVVGAAGDCAAFAAFQASFQGGTFADIPFNATSGAWGAQLAVQAHRACPGEPNPDAKITSAYSGLDTRSLGQPTPPLNRANRYEYGLPVVHLGGRELTSQVYIQNASLECNEVELWLSDPADCDAPPRKCAAFSLAPGQARAVDAWTCASGMAGAGGDRVDTFGWVRAIGPAAVVVDSTKWSTAIDSLLTYTARPRYVSAANSSLSGDAQPGGSAVAFAPLMYSEYQGWENTIHALNLDLEQPAKVKVTFLDRSGDIIGSFVEWICPGAAESFYLPMVAGLPGNWVGSVRIESVAYRMPDGIWRDPPPIQAVAEMGRWLTNAEGEKGLGEAIAYECLAEPEVLEWSIGTGAGGLASGIGVIALPGVTKAKDRKGVISEVAIANLVSQPGYTDFAILVFDANGLTDIICQKLHNRQVEYIDLATWGYINEGFAGTMVISAVRWTHTHAVEGKEIRDLVGLGAVLIQRSDTILGEFVPGDEAAAVPGIPLTGAAAQALAGLYTGADPCPIPPTATPEPTATVTATRPSPSATAIQPTATDGPSPTIEPTATMSRTMPTRLPQSTSTPFPATPTPTGMPEASPTAEASPTSAVAQAAPTAAIPIRVCPGLERRVPASVLAERLEHPELLAGWGERCNPALPASPWNGLRRSLTLANPAQAYQPVYNGLVLRCGCR